MVNTAPPVSPIPPPTPGVRHNLVLTCIVIASIFAAEGMLLLSAPLRALELGASPSLVGIIMSAPYLLPLIFAIPLGGTVSRLGSKRGLLAGTFGLIAAPWINLFTPSLFGLLLTQVIYGLSSILAVISAQSLVAGLGKGPALERYFSWYTMCLSGGQLIGPLVAGRMIDTLSMDWVFAAIGLTPVIGFIAALLLREGDRRNHKVSSSLLSYAAQITLFRSNIGVQISIAVSVIALFALGTYAAFLPLYLEDLAFSATLIGMLISLRAFSSMLIRPFMSRVIRVMKGRSNTLIMTATLIALGLMLTGTTSNIVLLAFMAILVGVGSGVSQPLSLVIISEHVHPDQRSSALGMRLTGNRGAQVVAPLIMGMLAEHFGFTWTFLIAGLILLSVMLMIWRLTPAFIQAEEINQ